MPELFDMRLRALRRDRAARRRGELFLLERAFDDCLQRVAMMNRHFGSALLIGCPDPSWPEQLHPISSEVDVRDPGRLFAARAGGAVIVEDAWQPPADGYDLVLAIGTLETVNDLPRALSMIRSAMRRDSLFIGTLSGGDTLPQLRTAMRAADALTGGAAPHVHPRIEPSSLPALLAHAGFQRPVVDIDRVQVRYRSLNHLIADLRAMAATNILHMRPPPLSRSQVDAAAREFAAAGDGQRTTETYEILHFAAWTQAS